MGNNQSIPDSFMWVIMAFFIIALLGLVVLIIERIYSAFKYLNSKIKQWMSRKK
jgi:uncharacterized protein HemY